MRCACVCMFAVQSVESCACAVFFVRWIEVCEALGMSASVESWSWQCFCVCCVCVSDLVFVRGMCMRWMCVVASAKCSACQSVFFLQFATVVRSPLTLRAATLSGYSWQSGCSGYSGLSGYSRLCGQFLPVRLVQLVRQAATSVNADISVTCHTFDG